jgi:hypothetical protein
MRCDAVDTHTLLSRRRLLATGGAAAAAAILSPFTQTVQAWSQPVQGRWFDTRFGPWMAGDIPHAYDIGGGRTLWITNDSFLARDGAVTDLDNTTFVRNAAFTERNGRVGLIHPVNQPFLAHQGSRFDRWWWFHGGITVDDNLHCFVTEMQRTGPPGWAINFEYASTWIATLSTRNGTVTNLRPAPDSGTRPVYGFAVVSDGRWTYLFGNNALYGAGTTDNFVARVPYGEVDDQPTYWDGSQWSSDAATARSIHTGGAWANRLHVFRHGQRWLATCKHDEFYGTDLRVLEAPSPTGPWKVIHRRTITTATGDSRTCTYDVQARTQADGMLQVWWSNNAYAEAEVRANPALYRPTAITLAV